MVVLLVLLFPVVLLGFLLFMERVEEPLNQNADERDIEQFLADANPEELDTFVREGTDSALTRFRERLGLRWRRRGSASRRAKASAAPPAAAASGTAGASGGPGRPSH